ncbi:lipid II:glycine glycyltransferase FemX [Sporosarcina sp. G11-34]|uniref:lipid II:glycine glycyltransferase FemX n=1 Tax=Sporosarcina sp. G11-34 TaxID=2849605 RepID=UPI0022A8D359|nr:peptidoglycan bridge formation glycyltransferase FemA/FemB family protein [Sporosarcina sp. G11-34]MCZ2260222.1 peptidoglycan bridge formation glycyltransferase FemA/FemB family protein [Sporosarcina sp. G11-34]
MALLDKTKKEEVRRYDEFIRNSPFRSVTQDRLWAQVKDDWGNEHVYLEENGEIVAAMSILIKRLPLGFSVLYAPRGPVCDPADLKLVQKLLKEAEVVAKKNKAIMLKFDPEASYSDELYNLYKNAGFRLISKDDDPDKLIQPRMNMILQLEDHDEETIMTKFSKSCRSSIRGSARKGVEMRYSRTDEDIETFHKVYKTMAERNKITSRPLEYMKLMRDTYDDLRIYIASHEGDVLAAGLTINYYGKLYYLYGGSTDVKRNLNPNHLMNFEMIKWGIETGAKQYDFGGVFELSKNDGLYTFKKSFCNKDEPAQYIGEIDKVYKPFMYTILETVIPLVKRFRKKLRRG